MVKSKIKRCTIRSSGFKCMQKQYKHEMCALHYKSWIKRGSPHLSAEGKRISKMDDAAFKRWFFQGMSHRDDETECINWSGGVNSKGYGTVRWKGDMMLVHRVAWILTNGEIPDGLFVCHICDVPSCYNVDHLFLGDNTDNMRDMVAKGRGRNQYSEPKENG